MNHDIEAPEVRNYLAALEARLAQLPTEQSEEIMFGVREHIAEATERGGQSTSEILAGLGSPDDIAAGVAAPDVQAPGYSQAPVPGQQIPQSAPAPRHQASTLWVVATTILLPFGILLAGVGWLFGVAGLWMGTRWKVWEKVMGTVLLPGGIVGAQILSRLITLPPRAPTSENPIVVDPFFPGLPLGWTIAVTCIPIAVALYLLVVGLRRGTKQP